MLIDVNLIFCVVTGRGNRGNTNSGVVITPQSKTNWLLFWAVKSVIVVLEYLLQWQFHQVFICILASNAWIFPGLRGIEIHLPRVLPRTCLCLPWFAVPAGRERIELEQASQHLTMSYFHLLHWHKLTCTKRYMKCFPQNWYPLFKNVTLTLTKWLLSWKSSSCWLSLNTHFANSGFKGRNDKMFWSHLMVAFLIPNLRYSSMHATTESWLISVHAYLHIICLGVGESFFLCEITLLSVALHQRNKQYFW